MNTMAIVAELADSGIEAVGDVLTSQPHFQPDMAEDHDSHVAVMEASRLDPWLDPMWDEYWQADFARCF